jgi:hypothetical protein
VALTVATIAVRFTPERRTARLLGSRIAASGTGSPPAPEAAIRVGRSVERVAASLPWRPACLPQALAVRAMLRRRGVECSVHLGMLDSLPRTAHAWVTVGGSVIQGGPVDRTVELARFR